MGTVYMKYTQKNGFTLIELLVGMALSSIAIVVIVSAYTIQVRGKNTQEALTDMNQGARAAFEVMSDEIRMAGLDTLGSANARIITAGVGELIFSMDMGNGVSNLPDGDCCDGNEIVRYHLSPAATDGDDNGVNDNIASGIVCNLGREVGDGLDPVSGCGGGVSGLQPLARNVDVLNFVYLNGNGAVIAYGNLGTQAVRDTIRSIEVTIVVRAGTQSGGLLYSYTNNNAYLNQQGIQILPAQGDAFRRLRLGTTIQCRNVN